jgi:predicted nucleic acid-binding protein
MPAASNEIVVNTGPLIALDACGQVELLHGLHPRVIVPQAVVTELTSGTHAAGAQVFNIPQWIELLPLRQAPSPLLRAHLDDGEASVIALAIELGCRLVVIDERRGRQVARLMGLDVTGTVGVLLRAKRRNATCDQAVPGGHAVARRLAE